MTSKPSFDFIDAPRQKLHAADRDQRELGLQPDAAAEAWRMGEAQGLQPELALRNAGDVRAEAERQRLDRLATDAPAVADWLAAKPERLAIARDDLETMGVFEKMYRNLVPADAGTRYVDTTMRAPAAGFVGYFGQAISGLADLNDSVARSMERGVRGVAGDGVADALNQPIPWWLNPSNLLRWEGQGLRDAATIVGVPEQRQNFATDVSGGVGQLGGVTLQTMFAPQTTVPTLFGLGAGQQADEARAAGQLGTPEADAAVMLGAPTTAALERFGIEKLLNRLPPKLKNDAARWFADKGLAFAYEGGQEVVEGVAQDVIGKSTFDPQRNIGEGLTYEGIVAGTSAGIVRTLLGIRSPLRPVVESADDVAKVQQLHELGGQLKTLDRNPAEVEALVRGIVDRAPGTPTHVYLDAEQLVTYFQTANLDPAAEIAKLTGDPDGAQLAAAAGGDIVVPIERYVARGVKSAHAEALKGMARLRADGASNAELEGLDVDALFSEIAPDTSAAADRADPNAAPADPVAEVAGAVRVQLEAAGVEPSAATAQADLLAQRYATRAARRGLGETALQVYEAAQLAIRSATPGDVQRRTRPGAVDSATDSVLDALRTQTGPSDFDTFGPSLVEVLAKRGGIRDDAMAGEIRSLAESDSERFKALLNRVGGKRPKASKEAKAFKPLTPADATMTLDDAVEAARESGFLREGEGINELIDALQDELVAERPRYSEDYRNPDLMAMRESMRALDEVLSEQGIDLATLSNAEVRAALARAYEQAGAPTVLDFSDRTDAELDAEYDALPATESGRRLDTDLVRELSPEYRADRTLAPAVHKAASAFTQARFDRMLAKPVAEGRDAAVMFTAGGGGSGKSTATAAVLGENNADIIFDGTLSNLAKARKYVEATLATGRDVRIAYVYRSPANSVAGAIGRAIRSRRPVPVGVLAEAHANAPKVAKALAEEYAGDARVEIVAINNDGAMQDAERMPIGSIPEVDQNEAEAIFRAALEEARAQGALDADLYAAFDGRAADAQLGAEGDRRDAERGPEQPARNAVTQTPPTGGVSASEARAADLTDDEIFDLLSDYGRNVDTMADAEKAWTEGDLVFIHNEMADGEPYLASSIEQIRNATTDNLMVVRREDFDASDATTLNQPADGTRPAPRGRIVLGRNGERTIELLDGANLSTFHHETGHLFLDELVEDAFTPGTPDGLRADLDLLLTWWGLPTRTADGKAAVMAAIKVDQHETFARGYEAYLFEGKAPAPGLADLMARFRTWMIAVYRQLSALNVKLSDEVRGVYARLLATDDQVAAAEQSAGYTPLAIPADVQGLLPAGQWAKYQDMLSAATVEARQAVEQRLLAAQQREAKAWWRDRRAEIREQVQAEGFTRQDFVALSVLSRGKMPDGSDPPEGLAGMSLSRERLVELYGEAFVKDTLGPRRVFRKTGGMSPSAAAVVLGYPDGGALVDAIANAPKLKEWIEGETDARMREQYPDPLLDGSLPAEAMAAVHSNKRLQALEYELNLLAVVAGQPALKPRVLAAAARQRIAGMKPRDIRPNDYLVAERKAARLATRAAAAGNYAEALRRKREQALSAHLYRAALDATAEFDVARDYLRKFTRTDTRARLGKAGGSYLEQIDGLLELVEVRQVSLRAVERRQTLADWVERRAAEGESIDVPDSVLALTRLTNLRDMPIEQLRGLVDTVKQIDHLARLKTELLLGKERRDRAQVDAEMAASVRAARGGVPENKGDRTLGDRAREAVDQGLGAYLRPSTMARDLDGFENAGAVWTHTVGIVQDAVNNQLTPALQQGQEALATIWRKHYTDAELRRMNTAVSRGALGSWSKGRILTLALNWGNTGNREALLSQARKRLAPVQIGELLGTLDARDVAFLNDIWAHVDSYWPAIAEAQKRRTGLVSEKVEAAPFAITLVDGTTAELNGGYFPLKYESEGDPKANQDEQTEFWDAIRTGRFTKAQTKNGHTKERVGSGGRTVRLDISVLGSHVRDVLRDVHLGDAVNYVHKTLQGPEFRSALSDVGKLEYARALDLWLRDVATGEMAPRTFFERMGRKLRTNFTASLLGFNISSALIQPTGFLQTGASLGWSTLGTGLQRLISSPWTGPNSVGAAVDRVSPMMRARAQVSVETVRKAEKALAGQRDSYVMRHAWAMMARTQRIVDLATWLGAEARGMDEFGGDVARARAFADDAVQRAQASGEFADKSALERGTFGDNVRQSELLRGTTALMSYMIAKGNVVYERTRQTNYRNPGQVGRLAVDLVSLLVIENLLIAVLRGGLPSDEDEDGILDDAAAWFVKEGALGLLGTLPIIGQAGTTLRGYDAQGVIERLASSGKKVTDALLDYADDDEPLTRSDIKAAVSLVGMLTGLPASQTNRMLDAYLANEEGEDIAAHEFLIGKRKE